MTRNETNQVPDSSATAGAAANERVTVSRAPFPIVGVGASAGGLEAFTQFLKHLPLDTGMGFVLVQHLDPEHESALTHILSRATSLPVNEITDNQSIQPNHVYVIPRDTNLSVEQGVLKLMARAKTRTPTRSIDFFFEALAQDQREWAIGVILSGTATDGTLGLEAIKAEGGITFAQDDSAKYDSMPRSAVAAGCVDLVLPPQDIAKELARIAKHPYVAEQPAEFLVPEGDREETTAHEDDETPLPPGGHESPKSGAEQADAEAERGGREKPAGAENGFKKILLLLRNHSGVDFALYKAPTIQRRITRRMVLSKQTTLEDYTGFLRGNTKELDALYSDLLISVTSFFRNPEAFDVLKRTVFSKLLQSRGDDPLRVWVLGCSTGQEAYSIAMAFVEAAEKAPRLRKLQVFATDLNDALLDKARHGLYAKNQAADVSPERLRRFFVEEEGGYRIVKSLREMMIFARQNLISDPPFSRMDLISCRNLLIYLEPSLQKRALPTFHYALKTEGFLFLGTSESIGGYTDLFEPADKKHKLYSKKAAPTQAFHLPVAGDRREHASPGQRPPTDLATGQSDVSEGFRGELHAQREADRVTVNRFAPSGVLINTELQILQFRGPTSAYLKPPTGKASFDVLKMAQEGLMLPLRTAINEAKKGNKTARKENVRIEQHGTTRTVHVEVIPLRNLRECCFLILFEDAEKKGTARDSAPPPQAIEPCGDARSVRPTAKEESLRIAELETELSETRDYLRSIQEQHEAANEELQAANEEVQSANEELQSINDELETSKEELESANEELTTVNDEMSNRNTELNRLNSDLLNLQVSTKLAIVLLGRDLTIRRFSAQAEKQFALLAADIGRPIGNVRHHLAFPELESFIADVIASFRERECEVRDQEGRWYSLRVRPYVTLDNKVDGAVLVLVDIDALKRTEQAITVARDYAENIIETVREPLLVLDGQLRVESANASFYRTFRVEAAETIAKSIFDLGNRQWNVPKLRTLLEEILPRNSVFDNLEIAHDFENLGRRTMLLNARVLKGSSGQGVSILLGIQDITELMHFQAEMRRSEQRYRRLFEAARDGVLIVDPATRKILDANPFMTELLGYTRQELVGKELFEIGLLKDEAASRAAFRELQKEGFIRYEDLPLETNAGKRREVELVSNLYKEDGEQIIQCNVRDITERKRAQALLSCQKQAFEMIAVGAPLLDVLELLMRAAESQSPHQALVAIHLLNQSGSHFDRTVAPSLPPGYSQAVDGMAVSSASGCCCAAVTSGRRVVVPDIAGSKEYPAFAAFAVPLGLRAAWSTPIFSSSGKVLGSFVTYYREVREPEPQEESLGEIVTRTAAVVIERKEGEEKLRESEERFRMLADNMSQFAWTADAKGEIYWYNQRWYDYTGTTPEEMQGWGWMKVHHPDHVDRVVKSVQHSVETGEPWEETFPLRGKDGSYRWFLSRSRPIRDEEGNVLRWFGTNTDITEQRSMADALRQNAADMSEADRRKNEFLAMLAHELRNPLAPIRNALQIMRLTNGDGEAVYSASEMMKRQVGQMVRLVDDLLDVSRISRGKIELRRGRIELASVVNQAIEAARPSYESMDQELTVTLPPKPIYLNADPTRLAQIIGNLLNNASKFTDKGGRISLTVKREGEQAVIRVQDNGIGIAPNQLPRIFDMFMQVDTSLERSVSGLGIGLTLVKNLVEMHGGTLEVHSAGQGQGSEFVVRLPVLLETAKLPPPEPIVSAPTTVTPRRILVVDDNRDSADSLAMLLKLTGNETHTAYDGLEAVEAAGTFQPEVVLLDIGLPKLNGYEACRKIREQPWGKVIVLIALTGWGQEEDRQKSREAGFNGHLVKPVDHAALMKLLAELLPTLR